jgi:hypothetical protein
MGQVNRHWEVISPLIVVRIPKRIEHHREFEHKYIRVSMKLYLNYSTIKYDKQDDR